MQMHRMLLMRLRMRLTRQTRLHKTHRTPQTQRRTQPIQATIGQRKTPLMRRGTPQIQRRKPRRMLRTPQTQLKMRLIPSRLARMVEKAQFELWVKYEDITMHFNDLLIRLRTQALGGVATIVTAAGFLASGQAAKSAQQAWEAVMLVAGLLLVGWITVWVIDVAYYNRLLRGAVLALLKLETNTKYEIDFSHTVERAVRKTHLEQSEDGWAWHVHLFYFPVSLLLLIVFVSSACKVY
jgi:hypothetical protein